MKQFFVEGLMDLRKSTAEVLVRFLKSSIQSGYSARQLPPSQLRWLTGCSDNADFDAVLASEAVFVIPTYLERCSAKEHAAAIRKIVDQLDGPIAQVELTSCRFIVAFQHAHGQESEAREHVAKIVQELGSAMSASIAFAMIDLHGKVNALNKCIAALRTSHFAGLLGWVDDDVVLGVDCLAMLKRHLSHHPVVQVAGAQKIPIPNVQKAAHFFLKMKTTARQTSRPIPHGCALLGCFAALREGIPPRYVGEDGYLSMHFFDEEREDALEQMAVVQGATCVHTVGGPVGEIFKRVRRTIDLNSILLADFEESRSVRFAQEVIFHGLLSDPLPHQEQTVSWKNKAIKVLLLWMYFKAGLRFKLRSVFRQPMQSVSWNGYSGYSHPDRN
jgi:hypothetical protein